MKHTSPLLLALVAVATCLVTAAYGWLAGLATFSVMSPMAVIKPIPGRCNAPTLTAAEILIDVIDAFVKKLPMLKYIGADFRPTTLKLNQSYTAHVPSVPTVEDVSNGDYSAMTGQNARDLLTDVPVTVNKHKGSKLKWSHINAIKDNKMEYDKVIALAGYALAKQVVSDIIAGFTPVNFSASSVYAVADSDCDMLDNICGDLNIAGAIPTGRYGVVNTSVANILAGDARLTSADYAGQRVRGEGYRRWADVNGFSEIMEYPDLSNTTSGTALTGVTVANTGDLFTKANHNLATGQTVTAASFSAGFTDGTYYAIRVSSSTFQLASSHANAIAGTAVAASADGTGGVITPIQTLTGFFGEARAITMLGGIPDGMDLASLVGISVNRVNNVEVVTHPELGISIAGISWEDAGKLDINFVPTLVYGLSFGRQTATGAEGAPGALMDAGGHRLVSA
jgi:hypothetical protein